MGIRHSSNEHSLSFRNLQNDQKEYCGACTKEILKTAYSCICGFRLHESCSREVQQLPHKTIHPLHSQHDLELKLEVREDFICDKCLYIFPASGYNCNECDFSLDLACASPTNDPLPKEKWQRPKDGKRKEIQHYSHLHKLTFFKYTKIRNYGYNCSWCEKCLSEVCYGCVRCKFFLHELCRDKDKISFEKFSSSTPQSIYSNTLLTEEMEHNEVIDGIHTPQQLLIGPIIHRHPMRFYEVVEKSKKNHYCEACRLVHSGPCYSCTTSSTAHTEYYLHEKSAKLPYEIQHPFHSSHPLILHTYHYRRGLIICDECRDVCRSLFYSCDECDFKLDVKCATLTTHKTDVLQLKEMERVAELNHFNHPHELVFGNCSDPVWTESCRVCQLPMLGPAYFCLNSRCSFKVHEFCLGMPQKMQVPFHLKHMFFGKSDKSSQCYACRNQINIFLNYSCKQCDLDLHPLCANC
ncbi:hypothetical protein POUND7_008587 [Theobroma cacao]